MRRVRLRGLMATHPDPTTRSNLAPRLAYDDLRQWLDEARNLGEVKDVNGLSWQQEIGMVAGVALLDDTAPCFVFGEVPGTYRVMVHDAKTAGFYISPGKHGRQMRDKYQARGEPMPVAVVCGGDPMTFLMACSEVPYGVCEYEIVGGVRG